MNAYLYLKHKLVFFILLGMAVPACSKSKSDPSPEVTAVHVYYVSPNGSDGNAGVIKNNIVYARATDVFVHKYTATGSNNIIDNNLYYTTGTANWIWNGTSYTDFTSWKTACGGDAGSAFGADPLMISTTAPDLHIQTGSPAKNTGVVTSTAVNGNTDIDGNTRIVNNKISKGAQQ